MSDAVRTFVCEDNHRLRSQLCRMLDQDPGFLRIGDASSAEAAEPHLSAGDVDVLLLDLELPGMSGLELLGRLPGPPRGPEVLILTTFADAEKVLEAMRRGAAGYLIKGVSADTLLTALREVAAGGTVIEPRLARRFWNLFEASKGRKDPDALGLSDEEVTVLNLVARGLTNPEVGHTLGTTRRRVKGHLESIYRKLNVSGRVEAVLKATAAGLVEL